MSESYRVVKQVETLNFLTDTNYEAGSNFSLKTDVPVTRAEFETYLFESLPKRIFMQPDK